ncbi:amidohydrolase family protein [Tunturiibacter empetritectus]|uniref:Amidohydrolase YtcJ n=1 Tax=Tunturiibacter lichenicola TaxID=2051959 RepID=A0A852VEQ4_9BACT|nr:amidohydrolase family protein [Edaphobacter lichenicola]NYF88082.1 putative amidohydrolase YtcJ [Edaphobacter lichenicola]
MMKVIYDNNLRIFNHCNGDAAIDLFLRIHQKLGGKSELRPVIIHSQFVRRDQLDTYVKLGIVPSMFTLHTYFFGDVHVKNRGMQQASFISPMNTAMKMGLRVSNHSDFSVLPLDPMFIMWTAMNRTTRSGVVLGPEERITAYQALKAITTESAYEYMEEGSKGSIEPGKLADLVVLSENPLKVEGDAIKAIKVDQTFKEGNSIYKRKD